MKSSCDIYLLRDGEGPILYAPLTETVARVNEAAVGAVGRYLNGEPPTEEEQPTIGALAERGLFDEVDPPPLYEGPFRPTDVTLFPSDGCNLACRYCYASAGKIHHTMPIEVGKAAIDLVCKNAIDQGMENFVVGFHGNGEPFSAYPVVKALCEYARDLGERMGIPCQITIATNGVLNDEQMDFVLAYFDGVNISFDGLPELQDRQRPFPDGRGSFEAVDRTLLRLNESGVSFGIRATLTEASVARLPEIAAFVAERYPNCASLHVEPAWECGRCLTTGEKAAPVQAFIDRYLEAEHQLPAGGLELTYSAMRYGSVMNSFCGVSEGGFTVTAEGLATACYEVATLSDERSGLYVYGRYEGGGFVFDEEKLARLQRRNVRNMPGCQDCFCKWHCAGDCPAKVLGVGEPEGHGGSDRCAITRALTMDRIQQILAFEDGEADETPTDRRHPHE